MANLTVNAKKYGQITLNPIQTLFIVIGDVLSHKATDLKSSEEIVYHFNRRFPFPRGPVTACVNLKYLIDMSLEFSCLGEYFDWDVILFFD